MKISVIIPVKDRHEVLCHAVSSVLQQTYPIHEIIIVDDGSIPEITEVTLGSTDKRLKIIRLPRNLGAAAARNVGVEASSGDLIAFLDSDDVWFSDKIEKQVEIFQFHSGSSELLAVVCGWDAVLPGRTSTFSRRPVPSTKLIDFASGCWFCPGSTLLIARNVFNRVGPFVPQLPRLEDFEWFLRFALSGGRLIVAPVIGASIQWGQRARYSDVDFAASQILKHFAVEKRLSAPGSIHRRLRAWLQVELAAAARNDRRWLTMFWHLTWSFCFVPRTSVAIKRWWSIAPARGR